MLHRVLWKGSSEVGKRDGWVDQSVAGNNDPFYWGTILSDYKVWPAAANSGELSEEQDDLLN